MPLLCSEGGGGILPFVWCEGKSLCSWLIAHAGIDWALCQCVLCLAAVHMTLAPSYYSHWGSLPEGNEWATTVHHVLMTATPCLVRGCMYEEAQLKEAYQLSHVVACKWSAY